MYLEHFHLTEKPFSTSPDPRFFYLSAQHREAIAKTEYAVTERLGLSVVYGDVGTGKTTISRLLLQKFRDEHQFNAVLLTHPSYPSENQLLRAICQEFRIGKSAKAKLDLLTLFQAYLIDEWKHGHRPVLIIDEAQTLKPPLLELLRQLLNFETNTEKLLQVVLFGQNELRDRLDRKPNLKSRVAMWGALTTLTRDDTEAMLRFRYQVAGGAELPFPPAVLERVYRYARGVPRTTCIICDNAMLKTFLLGGNAVVEAVVDTVYGEMTGHVIEPEDPKVGRPRKQGQEVLHG